VLQSLQTELANQKSAMAVIADALQSIVHCGSGSVSSSGVSSDVSSSGVRSSGVSSDVSSSGFSSGAVSSSGRVSNGVADGSNGMLKKYAETLTTLGDVEMMANNKLKSLLQQLRLVSD